MPSRDARLQRGGCTAPSRPQRLRKVHFQPCVPSANNQEPGFTSAPAFISPRRLRQRWDLRQGARKRAAAAEAPEIGRRDGANAGDARWRISWGRDQGGFSWPQRQEGTVTKGDAGAVGRWGQPWGTGETGGAGCARPAVHARVFTHG